MTTSKMREVIIRAMVPVEEAAEIILATEPCGQDIWLSKTTKCSRHNVMGVSAKQLDVLVQDPLPIDGMVMVEIVNKVGKFDGAVRTRVVFRLPTPNTEIVDDCSVDGTEGYTLRVTRKGDTLWSKTFDRLRATAYQERSRELVMWHWSRYFRHLPSEVAEAVEIVIPEGSTVTSANRQASNRLYEESRALGWVKLTLREREKLGFPAGAGAWQREEVVAQKRAERAGFGSVTGCGEYTLTSAHP